MLLTFLKLLSLISSSQYCNLICPHCRLLPPCHLHYHATIYFI